MDIERKPGETDFEYHRRLIYGKLVDKTLADVDYSELAELAYGKQYASDVARRMFYGSRCTLELLDEFQAGGDRAKPRDDTDDRIVEMQKERWKLSDMRREFNRVVRERSRQEEVYDILRDVMSSGALPKIEYERTEIEPSDNDLLISLNDIHYGACHENFWGEYNSEICKEMMVEYVDRILDIAERHHSENCVVWENGDAISGAIHANIRFSNKENVIEQIVGVSELIAWFLSALSCHFKSVRFVSVAGNHSRISPNKDDEIGGERLDDLLEWYLRARLQNLDNVHFGLYEKIDPTIYSVDIRGLTYCGVHGDFDPSERNVLDIKAMTMKPVYAVLMGHKHHNKIDEVQGVKVIMAGSFSGVDEYCIKKRIIGRPQQLVCVCDDTGVICSYDINF